MSQFKVTTLAQTKHLAESLAKQLQVGDIIALYGTLGVGKTAFTRFLVQSFCGEKEEVPSPTFTLLQTYETEDFPIFHFDLYRLKKADEVLELGIEDAFYDGVSLIEWPEKMGGYLPEKKVLRVEIDCQDEVRTFTFSSKNPKWTERLEKWKEQI
ncbi:MAG: tRNA (adenosine(37)-N6)-threonylcarbamoyltransferase complex ATPase subunit type 1 TsaE [Alphaproteobacteria bacterium]|nr:tRNA (adenosine(37)-N6)-threonylcarbamoyltransferase complex ATPase subunit type 1 TsaE [Alphaproteobacteria bacterium]